MTCECNWSATSPLTPLDDFIPHAAVFVPEIPAEVIALRIRDTAIDFAKKTGLLKTTFCADLQAGVADYALDLPDGYIAHDVHAVQVHGVLQGRAAAAPTGVSFSRGGLHTGYTFIKGVGITLEPVPREDAAGCLCATVVCIPSARSCYLPSELYEEHAQTLVFGALSLLFLDKQAPWNNSVAARDFSKKYDIAVAQARNYAIRLATGGPITPRTPCFL